ncbi:MULTISPECIES: hypothetical protein [unclassified Janthinobacterium]|uniref:hypothetical protein n=1 Tax=unclassified Janthinobacterium TaxID=2610881 RepID=UPI00088C313E|nr:MULTISPECIES: hypothetical protein [unclassified Janthinobacterium]SDA62778.1 hypothetical protein SAMN03159349_02617 [Janthinobacterium sp. 551a]SFB20628.1 hypothetical protein SAMN03159300_102606 [Janthinobacterium sp. 344]
MASAPPLRIWLYSAALAVGMVGLCMLLRHVPGPRYDNTIAGQTKTFLDAPRPEGQWRVLALGSSLLRAATPQTASVQRADLPDIAWMRMTKGGGGIGYLQPSLATLGSRPPEMLVLEQNLFLPDNNNAIMDQLREDVWHWAKQAVSFLSAGKLASPPPYWEHNDQELAFTCNPEQRKLSASQIRQHATELQNLYRQGTFDAALINNIATLAQRGVRVVLLDVRRSLLIEQQTAQQKTDWQRHLHALLPASHNIIYISSPAFTQQDLYCDASHLNKQGARLFAPWWQSQLQQLRDGR